MTNSDDPAFFIPSVAAEDAEARYKALATFAGQPTAPKPAARIFSITFVHDGEEWTATVGQKLSGMAQPKPRRMQAVVPVHKSDNATVQAIFSGVPYVVVTDKGINGVRSAWENPFYAGQPKSERRFRA